MFMQMTRLNKIMQHINDYTAIVKLDSKYIYIQVREQPFNSAHSLLDMQVPWLFF